MLLALSPPYLCMWETDILMCDAFPRAISGWAHLFLSTWVSLLKFRWVGMSFSRHNLESTLTHTLKEYIWLTVSGNKILWTPFTMGCSTPMQTWRPAPALPLPFMPRAVRELRRHWGGNGARRFQAQPCRRESGERNWAYFFYFLKWRELDPSSYYKAFLKNFSLPLKLTFWAKLLFLINQSIWRITEDSKDLWA